ncbi:MAG: tetratricopeptide repeat protein [Chloroflexota bacterium]
MTHRRRTPALALVATLALAGCAASASSPASPSPAAASPIATGEPLPPPGAGARALEAGFIDRLKAAPTDLEALLGLGGAAYQLARETADPTEYGRAETAFQTVLDTEPASVDALVGLGTVALARHAFADGLAFGDRALAIEPRSARALGVRADGLTELGRYDEAKAAVQRMVDLRPDLGSYARVSYQRELHGDLDGAIAAMRAAVVAGGPAAENTAYLEVVLGNLWFLAGDLDRASAAMDAALAGVPGYAFALACQARVAAARGDLDAAIAGWQAAADRVPFPELLIGLGEAQEAAGRMDDAAATYDLVRQVEALFAANGVSVDLDLALFEADHGDPAHAVELAQAAWAATPNVKAADALGWALHQAGRDNEARPMAEAALRLGSLEPAYAYHAGVIAAAQGDEASARTWLAASLERNAAWSVLGAPRAAAALAALEGTAEVMR